MAHPVHLFHLCMALATLACASSHAQERRSGAPLGDPYPYPGVGSANQPYLWQEWKALVKPLQQQGFYQPTAPRNFRLGVPLARFGNDGPHLMLGYAPRLSQTGSRNTMLLFINAPLD